MPSLGRAPLVRGRLTFMDAFAMLLRGNLIISRDMMAAVSTVGTEGERRHARLTPRDLEILRALGRGATN